MPGSASVDEAGQRPPYRTRCSGDGEADRCPVISATIVETTLTYKGSSRRA